MLRCGCSVLLRVLLLSALLLFGPLPPTERQRGVFDDGSARRGEDRELARLLVGGGGLGLALGVKIDHPAVESSAAAAGDDDDDDDGLTVVDKLPTVTVSVSDYTR